MRKSLLALALIAALPAFVHAAEPKSPHTFTGNMTLASEYMYRGIAQTNRAPAVQGGFDYGHDSGIYLGTWASNISWLSDANSSVTAPVEYDFYGGFKGEVAKVGYDVGALQYYYPGTYPANTVRPYTTELYAAASYEWFTLKYSHSLTNLFGAKTPSGKDTKGSSYVELNGKFDVGAGVNLLTHVGYQKVADYKDASYADWQVGVTKEMFGVTGGLAYVGTNAKGNPGQFYYNSRGKDLGADRLLVTIRKDF